MFAPNTFTTRFSSRNKPCKADVVNSHLAVYIKLTREDQTQFCIQMSPKEAKDLASELMARSDDHKDFLKLPLEKKKKKR